MGALCLMVLTSAALISLSFPPFDLGFLAWIGLAPLLYALRKRGTLAAGGLAFLFGSLLVLGTHRWLSGLSEMNLPSSLMVRLLFNLPLVVFAIVYRSSSARYPRLIVLLAPALWVAMEYVRANFFFLAWPWNLLGNTQYRYLPVIQIADLASVYGVSFMIVLVNQVVSELPHFLMETSDRKAQGSILSNPATRLFAIHSSVVLLTVGAMLNYGIGRLSSLELKEHIRVALVQANAVARDHMRLPEQEEHLRKYRELTLEAARQKPDLIVWPSSSLPAAMNLSMLVQQSISSLARETGCYLLVGGAGYEKMKPRKERYLPFSNSEFLISPSGRLEGQYNKMRLLPFNEDLPLKGKINWPSWVTTLKEGFQPGESYTVFRLAKASFGTPICWENLFPDFFRFFVQNGANFMVSVTNDAFFGPTAGPYQSLAMNVFRAVENRVAIVRGTTTGVSAFIEPTGKIAEKVQDGDGKDLFVAGFLVRDVPLSNHKTFYTLYGDIFAYLAIGISVMTTLALFFRKEPLRAFARA
jgi:apolipoprotein N-acyltransferase